MPLTKITGGEFDNTQGGLSVAGIITATSGFVGNLTGSVSGNVTGNVNATGLSTFSGGPVLIGGGTSTGTASQPLQVTGGAYVSGNLGIGITNPTEKTTINGNILLDYAISSSAYSEIRARYIGQNNCQSAIRFYNPNNAYDGALTIWTQPNTLNASMVERMRIDGSGNVAMPYQPAFQTTGTNYSQSSAAYSIIIPNTVSYNQGSHYNASTGRFTAPIAGRYIFQFWGLSYPHNTEVNQIRGFVNGSVTGQEVQFGGAAHQHVLATGNLLLNLSANDVFDFRYYQSSGSGKAFGSQWNMMGYLLG